MGIVTSFHFENWILHCSDLSFFFFFLFWSFSFIKGEWFKVSYDEGKGGNSFFTGSSLSYFLPFSYSDYHFFCLLSERFQVPSLQIRHFLFTNFIQIHLLFFGIIYSSNTSELLFLKYVLFYYLSSSSCRAASTDIPDPLSPLLPIVQWLWQVFWATSRILTQLLYVCSSWSAICGGP